MRLPHGFRNSAAGRYATESAMGTEGLKLGSAAKKDLPRLVELLGVLFAQEADFVPDAGKQERALEAILADPKVGRIYTAREDGRVVAMVSILYTVSTAEGGKAAWLEDMVVDPACRGRGIGAALLAHAVVGAREAGCMRLTLLSDEDNAQAHAVYAAEGFQFSGMRPMRLKL
jgi:GNAT superfamily N-acetyltransferase